MSTATATVPPRNAPVKSPPRRPARKVPLSQRINMRMIVFAVVLLLPIGFIVYDFVDFAITGGVKDVGGGFKQVDLKAMSSFPLDQVNGRLEDIPKKWRDLDGQKVILYGEMWQPLAASDNDVKAFDLCYSITKCCFNGPPQVQHFVRSRVVPGRSLSYYPNLVKVTGTLHVHVTQDAGRVGSVYQLDVENIEPTT
jgi:hypothetical protein